MHLHARFIMDSVLNSTSLPPAATYTQLFAVAKQQQNLSTMQSLWQAHYAYWGNDTIATGRLISR